MSKTYEFNSFRRWFNQQFSLSFDGKFKGLSTLLRLYGARFVEHLHYRLFKLLYRRSSHSCPVSDVICISLAGHIIKLYNR